MSSSGRSLLMFRATSFTTLMPMTVRLARRQVSETSAIKIEKAPPSHLIIGAAKLPFSALTAAISVSLVAT